jgi:hypothetical protein
MNDVTIHFDSATRILTINGMSCQLADDDALTVETSTNPPEVSVDHQRYGGTAYQGLALLHPMVNRLVPPRRG